MQLNRRLFLAAAGTALASPYVSRSWAADDEIVIGSIFDGTGIFQPLGRPKANILKMAIDETNAGGGLLGKQVRLVHYDTQSSNQLYAQYAQSLIRTDKVDFVFGGVTSASREVIRPIFKRSGTPYFYNMAYEGGLCDGGTYITGITTPQILESLMPYLVKTFGKKAYIIGPDYNFGQISEQWIRQYARDNGCEVVGSELFPLDASNFTASLSKIQAAAPDFVIDSLVTPPQFSFYNQWATAGMKSRIGLASQTLGSFGQNLIMPPEVLEGVVVGIDYVQELDNPLNTALVKKYQETFGTGDYLGNLVEADYDGWLFFKAAVEKADTKDKADVVAALASGLELATPRGHVKLDPATHHCVMDVRVMDIRNAAYRVIETTSAVPPADLVGRCDLIAAPASNVQLGPKA
ncbi:ABC transporter substrate-binding protein [Rhizobium puerariae]|uniref:ABC transporter substrate-binding protein n=1 Tax=Rhizobium puerariae TaxID=1585791 RepID=A0ABV6AN06_9HYPH